jgi:hypothetical protein
MPMDENIKTHNMGFQCELSIVTATKLNDFIEQSKRDRQACEERYSMDRKEAQAFRQEVLEKIDAISKLLGSIIPSVETGRKIAWGVAALVAASVITGLCAGAWRIIKLMGKYL